MNEGERNSKYVVKEEVIPSSMNMKKMEEMIKQLATQISQEHISQLEKRVEKIEERKEKIAFKASKWKMNLGKIVGTTLLTFHFFRLSIPHLILMFPIVLMKIDIQKRYNEDGSRNKAMSYIQIFSSLGFAMIDSILFFVFFNKAELFFVFYISYSWSIFCIILRNETIKLTAGANAKLAGAKAQAHFLTLFGINAQQMHGGSSGSAGSIATNSLNNLAATLPALVVAFTYKWFATARMRLICTPESSMSTFNYTKIGHVCTDDVLGNAYCCQISDKRDDLFVLTALLSGEIIGAYSIVSFLAHAIIAFAYERGMIKLKKEKQKEEAAALKEKESNSGK